MEADLAAESNSWNRWDQTERLLWITAIYDAMEAGFDKVVFVIRRIWKKILKK